MYECYNARRFIRLVMLDIIIFSICFVFIFIGKNIIFSAADTDAEEDIFLPVIMYHSIHNDAQGDYEVTPQQLEQDLAYLKNNGYNTISAQQLADYVYNGSALPQNPVMITLDDGFYNNLYYLLPLLEKYDMNAIVSIVGSYVENNAAADPHVPEYSYLTWEDVNLLLGSGRVEIGNHTYNMHSGSGSRKGCSKNYDESVESYAEIFNADVSMLQSEIHLNTGTTPIAFAYPFGYISRESLPLLRENGFLMTFTCYEKANYINRNPDCLFGLNRYNRSGVYSTEEFMRRVLGE